MGFVWKWYALSLYYGPATSTSCGIALPPCGSDCGLHAEEMPFGNRADSLLSYDDSFPAYWRRSPWVAVPIRRCGPPDVILRLLRLPCNTKHFSQSIDEQIVVSVSPPTPLAVGDHSLGPPSAPSSPPYRSIALEMALRARLCRSMLRDTLDCPPY